MTQYPEYVKSLLLQENDKVFNLAEFRPILRDSTLENIKVPKIQFIPNRIVKLGSTFLLAAHDPTLSLSSSRYTYIRSGGLEIIREPRLMALGSVYN